MLRMFLDQRRERWGGSLWLMPLIQTLAALSLGMALDHESKSVDAWLSPVLFHGGAEEARRVLITVATATIGVFAVVVGLTLVALQIAANRYSPRLVRTILRDKPTQFVLGLFIATFAYNAAGLYTVGTSGNDQDYPRLAVTVGLVLLFLCIAALVYYVDRVAHTIQIHSILKRVSAESRKAIKRHPAGVGREAGQIPVDDPRYEPPPTAIKIVAEQSGHVQRLRTADLVHAADAHKMTIKMVPGIGSHVVCGSTLAWAWSPTDSATPTQISSLGKAINHAVTIGRARSGYGDVALSASEMVDIALVSLHIFDYHTVEQSAGELTILLSRIAGLPLGDEVFSSDSGAGHVVVPAPYFSDYLELACGEIRRKGSSEPVVLLALARLLRIVGVIAGSERLDAVYQQFDLIRSSAERSISEKHDLQRVLDGIDEARQAIQRAKQAAYTTDPDQILMHV
ncbi:MAG: DUF2254 domain-containing protein [Microlunatus sp.]